MTATQRIETKHAIFRKDLDDKTPFAGIYLVFKELEEKKWKTILNDMIQLSTKEEGEFEQN